MLKKFDKICTVYSTGTQKIAVNSPTFPPTSIFILFHYIHIFYRLKNLEKSGISIWEMRSNHEEKRNFYLFFYLKNLIFTKNYINWKNVQNKIFKRENSKKNSFSNQIKKFEEKKVFLGWEKYLKFCRFNYFTESKQKKESVFVARRCFHWNSNDEALTVMSVTRRSTGAIKPCNWSLIYCTCDPLPMTTRLTFHYNPFCKLSPFCVSFSLQMWFVCDELFFCSIFLQLSK